MKKREARQKRAQDTYARKANERIPMTVTPPKEGREEESKKKEEEKPYDPSGDLIKMPGWKFECVGNNHALRTYMDMLHRNGEIYLASRSFPFRNCFVNEPRFFGPACYEDYAERKRRFVPCMMVMSVYVTVMNCQVLELQLVLEKAEKEHTTPKKAEAIAYFKKINQASLQAFDMEIKKICQSCYDECEYMVYANNALKMTKSKGKAKTEQDHEDRNFKYEDLKQSIIMHKMFEAGMKQWLNTYELQRLKNASLLSLIAIMSLKSDSAVSIELLKNTTLPFTVEQVGGTIYNKYECTPEHPFTDLVILTTTREEVDQASLDIADEFKRAEPIMQKALDDRSISRLEGPRTVPPDSSETPLPTVDLARYDEQNQKMSLSQLKSHQEDEPSSETSSAPQE